MDEMTPMGKFEFFWKFFWKFLGVLGESACASHRYLRYRYKLSTPHLLSHAEVRSPQNRSDGRNFADPGGALTDLGLLSEAAQERMHCDGPRARSPLGVPAWRRTRNSGQDINAPPLMYESLDIERGFSGERRQGRGDPARRHSDGGGSADP